MAEQQSVFEKFQDALASLPEGRERVETLNDYAWQLSRIDPNRSIALALEAKELAERIEFEAGVAESYKNLGQGYWLVADYVLALEKCIHAQAYFEKANMEKSLADTYNIMGAIYAQQGDKINALRCYELSLDLKEKVGDNEGLVRALNSIGDYFMKDGFYEEALKYFRRCEQIDHSHPTLGGIVLYNIGECYFRLDRDDEALEYLNRVEQIGKKLNFTLMVVYCKRITGELALKRGNLQDALDQMHFALDAAIEVNARDLMYELHYSLSLAYKKLGNTNKALEHFEQYHTTKESVLGDENSQKLKNMQFHFQTMAMQRETEVIKTKNAELQAAYDEIEEQKLTIETKNKHITDSINYAKRIQEAILPEEHQIAEHFDGHFVVFKPKDIVSGDFYWFSQTKDYVFLAVADCTGHGVPGAMVSMVGSNMLNQIVNDENVTSPSQALDILDRRVYNSLNQGIGDETVHKTRDGMDISFCVFEMKKRVVQFAGAYRPLIIIRNNELIEQRSVPSSIGDRGHKKQPYQTYDIELQKGDRLYMFSDGYPDQFGGAKGKKLMYKRFKELLLDTAVKPIKEQGRALSEYFENWRGNLTQIDDICVVGVVIP